MAIFASFVHIHGHKTVFRWYDCQWPWAYFKVIGLFHIKFLKNVIGTCDTAKVTNRKSYTSFRLVPLLMTLKYIWRSFQPRLSFLRPFQQSLACFRVARSPSNSWAFCVFCCCTSVTVACAEILENQVSECRISHWVNNVLIMLLLK